MSLKLQVVGRTNVSLGDNPTPLAVPLLSKRKVRRMAKKSVFPCIRGQVRRTELVKALQAMGGRIHRRGGETLIHLPGTTVIVGRRDFSRAMLVRLERKLCKAGISPISLHEQLMN